MERILVPWCKKHFEQASETLLTETKWSTRLDLLGDCGVIKDIMDGEYLTTNEERVECCQFVEELQVKKGVRGKVELRTTFKTFQALVKKVKENKTSSPSKRHYGHYKVLAMEEELLRVVYDVIDLALERGIVLKRWREVHQMLLLKDPPRSKVHRFWNITIVEADLMFVMKDVWARQLGGGYVRKVY